MGIIATKTEGTNISPVPNGNHIAICYEMIEIGTVYNETHQKHEKKVRIGWELCLEKKQFKPDEPAKPYVINREFTLSMHEKSTLRQFLESWRGKKFTDDESRAFDVTVLLGKPCLLNVVHSESNNKVYSNVSGITSVPKGTTIPTQVNQSRLLSYDNFDWTMFDSLPDFLKDKMKKTPEFEKLMNQENHEIDTTNQNDDLPF